MQPKHGNERERAGFTYLFPSASLIWILVTGCDASTLRACWADDSLTAEDGVETMLGTGLKEKQKKIKGKNNIVSFLVQRSTKLIISLW